MNANKKNGNAHRPGLQYMAVKQYHTLTNEEDATDRAILAASASLSEPVTVTCIGKGILED